MAIPDEVWERFENDSERDIRSSAPKEPSARARMVAERLRRLDEEAARQEAARAGRLRRRRAKRDAEPVRWRPDDWRAAPTGSTGGGRSRSERSQRVRQVRSVVIVFGFMALAIVLLSPLRFYIWG
ncbi:hypothetical protein [Streptomyces flavofungini]|uniref:hypothetical protein n=1 Tax=Streptomyces flavofungini TaxID=68200 RepID=UPI0034DF9F9E